MSARTISFSNRVKMIGLILALVLSLFGATFHPAVAADEVTYISIVSVVKNKSVTIQVNNMRTNTEYRVLMNKIGTLGVNGVVSGTAKTDSKGSFRGTFPIPASLNDLYSIAIRIQATGSSGSYAYNWFINNSSGTSTSSSGAVYTSGNISLTSVIEDVSVAFTAKNAPANTRISIYIDWANSRGEIKGLLAGTVLSASDGSVSATAKFPSGAKDRSVVALRLQAAGYKASVWFLNATTKSGVGGGAPASDPSGIPYINIVSVVKGDEVKIELNNLPLKKEFTVRMSNSSALGVGGIEVGTVKATKKGAFTATFDIPRSLRNRDKIAIRIEAADGSGYYAFNWFENETTP